METILLDTTPIQRDCWLTRINPAYLERFAPEMAKETWASVVVVEEAEYDPIGQALVVRGDSIHPLAIGTSDTAIVLARQHAKARIQQASLARAQMNGDEAFLKEAARLPIWAQESAAKILAAVREIDDGGLERGERSKFVNRPNNFWTITAQPQAKGFAITIYGRPHLFTTERIKVLDDRPGHSRFVIRDSSEVPEAIRLIKASKELKS